MPSLKTIGAFAFTLLLGLLGIFSARAKQAKAERDQAHQQADIAQRVNDLHKEVDQTVQKIETRHQQETENAKDQLKNDHRSQLDSDW